MTEEPSLIYLAESSSKLIALLALILFNVLEIFCYIPFAKTCIIFNVQTNTCWCCSTMFHDEPHFSEFSIAFLFGFDFHLQHSMYIILRFTCFFLYLT